MSKHMYLGKFWGQLMICEHYESVVIQIVESVNMQNNTHCLQYFMGHTDGAKKNSTM